MTIASLIDDGDDDCVVDDSLIDDGNDDCVVGRGRWHGAEDDDCVVD